VKLAGRANHHFKYFIGSEMDMHLVQSEIVRFMEENKIKFNVGEYSVMQGASL